MIPLVKLPEIVSHYAEWFTPVFSEAELRHCQRYLSGLIVSENKTVDGINRLFVHESRHQSTLNRWLTASTFSEKALNQRRLALLASLPGTQLKKKGVLSVDDSLLKHYGRHFEKIAYLWDHVEEHYAWAHNLVTIHYSDDQTDYPVRYQLWEPADLERIEKGLRAANVKMQQGKFGLKESDPIKWRQYLLGVWRRHQEMPEVAALYQSKLLIAQAQLRDWTQAYPDWKLPVVFDSWYTQPAFCRYLDQELKLSYVGTLDSDNVVILKSGAETIPSFAKRLKKEHLTNLNTGQQPLFRKITIRYKGDKETYYSYCRTLRIKNFGKQRVVINYRHADLSDSPAYYNSNRLHWQATGITRIHRHRWPVEVYYQEGKAEGLDQYQVRDFQAISRHIGLVAVAYSLLRAAPHDQVLLHKLQHQLKYELEGSVPFWRRTMQAQSLWNLATLIAAGLAQGQSLEHIMSPWLTQVYA